MKQLCVFARFHACEHAGVTQILSLLVDDIMNICKISQAGIQQECVFVSVSVREVHLLSNIKQESLL